MRSVKLGKSRPIKRTRPQPVRARSRSIGAALAPQQVQPDWGMSTNSFARLTGFSPRKIAQIRSGAPVTPATAQRLAELNRLRVELSKVVRAGALAQWMETPNESFGGLKPLEVVERGETDRLWRMCYQLSAGEPG